MQNICVAGIHTEIGKTAVSSALCAGFGYGYFKLIQAGSEQDRTRVQELLAKMGLGVKIYPNGITLELPASPHLSAVDYDALNIALPAKSGVLVELAGGLYTPLGGKGGFMIDYIIKYSLKTLLVAREYLGCINHTMLSLNALCAAKIECLGVIISGGDTYLGEFLRARGIRVFCLDEFDSLNGFTNATASLKNQLGKLLG